MEICALVVMVGLEIGLGNQLHLQDGASLWSVVALNWVAIVIIGCFFCRIAMRALENWRVIALPRHFMALVLVSISLPFSVSVATLFVVVHEVVELWHYFRQAQSRENALLDLHRHPARSLVLSFLGLIGVGTIVLAFPVSSKTSWVGIVDAFFTAVSAVCVTGLATVDTAAAWSPFGQGVVLALCQLGGLGIMVISAVMALALGHSLTPRSDAVVRDVFDEPSSEELRYLLRDVALWTLLIEFVGALLLFGRFVFTMPWREAAFSAIFHSISAFCNAGFSIYSDSLGQFVDDVFVNTVVAMLIILGGLGFGVLMGLRRYFWLRSTPFLSIHTKLVLGASAFFLVTGTLFFFFFEYDSSLAKLPLGAKMTASFFQSVTTRTAGFNTVRLEHLNEETTLFMMLGMLIGAAPGSTGGGIKITTVAVIALSIRAFLTDRQSVEFMGRRLPPSLLLRAMALMGTATAVYVLGLTLLLIFEDGGFLGLAFETASALGTAGLSLGVTSELSVEGKLVVACLMFVGRVGPLTLVAAMRSRNRRSSLIQLPEGRVLIG